MAAEKLHMLAEQCFLAGDLAGALRAAREAQTLCRTPLPDLSHALAAYEVHAAAAISRTSGRNWYAVLSVGAPTSLPSGGGNGVTHEDVKRRYRQLCLLLHPDKNPSAAADGAFKLLQEAWKTLSARHPPAPSTGGAEPPRSAPTPSPVPAPASAARPSSHKQKDPTTAGADRDTRLPPFGRMGLGSRRPFQCPARCPHCRAGFEWSMVSVGIWNLRCAYCHRDIRVHVRGRFSAESW